MTEALADPTVLPGLKQVSGCWLMSYFCEKPACLHLPTQFLDLHILSFSRSACERNNWQRSRSHVWGSAKAHDGLFCSLLQQLSGRGMLQFFPLTNKEAELGKVNEHVHSV